MILQEGQHLHPHTSFNDATYVVGKPLQVTSVHTLYEATAWTGDSHRCGAFSVVLKLIACASEDDAERLIYSINTLKNMNLHGLIYIYDVFSYGPTTVCYVMDHIDGETLQQSLDTHGQLGEQCVLRFMQPVAQTVSRLHKLGFLHLDIKPSNIMVNYADYTPLLIDVDCMLPLQPTGTVLFGKAPHHSKGFTAPEMTPFYGHDRCHARPQSDIYSLAATCYALLTGIMPPTAYTNEYGNMELSFSMPQNISAGLRQAIVAGMNPYWNKRPSTVDDFLRIINAPASPNDSPHPEVCIVTPNRQTDTQAFYRKQLVRLPPIMMRGLPVCLDSDSSNLRQAVQTIISDMQHYDGYRISRQPLLPHHPAVKCLVGGKQYGSMADFAHNLIHMLQQHTGIEFRLPTPDELAQHLHSFDGILPHAPAMAFENKELWGCNTSSMWRVTPSGREILDDKLVEFLWGDSIDSSSLYLVCPDNACLTIFNDTSFGWVSEACNYSSTRYVYNSIKPWHFGFCRIKNGNQWSFIDRNDMDSNFADSYDELEDLHILTLPGPGCGGPTIIGAHCSKNGLSGYLQLLKGTIVPVGKMHDGAFWQMMSILT